MNTDWWILEKSWLIRKNQYLFEKLTWNDFFSFWLFTNNIIYKMIKWIFHINSFLSVTISYVNFLNWSYIMKSNLINRDRIKVYIEHNIIGEWQAWTINMKVIRLKNNDTIFPLSIITIKSNSCWCLWSFSFHIIPLLVMEGHNRKD